MENKIDGVKRVLVVDDEKDIRDGCERILRRMGCQVLTASRGMDGLSILAETTESIPIVLLDLKMPGMDGMEVLGRIREMNPEILVIIITGFATVETAIEAMKQGAYDFIPKPFEPDHVRIVVRRACERLRLTHEAEQLEREQQKTLLDLGAEKSRIRTVIESLPSGVVVTNAQGQVVLLNPAFLRQFGLEPDRLPGDPIETYLEDAGFCDLVTDISEGKRGVFDTPYEMALPDDRYLRARGQPVMSEEGECLGAVVIFGDITDMKELDRLKSEFVAKVSHELRSPLATIHEQLALVLKEMVREDTSEEEHHLLTRAQEKTRGLITLIGDLLDLSRIESGTVRNEPMPVRVDELLGSIVDFLLTRARAKTQSLTLKLPENQEIPPVIADPISLESIFGNLITNAINYTQEGGEIAVSLDLVEDSPAGPEVCAQVRDNGFGIDPRYQEKIFDRFFRVKNDKTRFITGTGLGLPIVKGLVDSMGGTIELDSAVGKGTTFTVILPVEDNTEKNEKIHH